MPESQAQIAQEVKAAIEKSLLQGEKTCTVPWVANYSIDLPNVPINLQQLMTILAAVACIVNTLLALHLMWGHLFHWTRPAEQRQIVRIIIFVPFYSICQFFSIWFYNAAGSILPVANLYEGYAVTALFMLYVNMVAPNAATRPAFFAALERKWVTGKVVKNSNGSLRWFRNIWLLVFQLTIFRIAYVAFNATVVTVLCPLNKTRALLLMISGIVQGTSTAIAVLAIVVFETRVRSFMVDRQSVFKLISFKGVVGLEALQGFLFPILASKSVFIPSAPYHISYQDFSIGIPTFILIWAITLVAVLFQWSFSFKIYRDEVLHGEPIKANAGRAFLSSFNPFDIYWGLFVAFRGMKVEDDVLGETAKLEAVSEAPARRLDSDTSYEHFQVQG